MENAGNKENNLQILQDEHAQLLHKFIIAGAKAAPTPGYSDAAIERQINESPMIEDKAKAIELAKAMESFREHERSLAKAELDALVKNTSIEKLISDKHGESILSYAKKNPVMQEVAAQIIAKGKESNLSEALAEQLARQAHPPANQPSPSDIIGVPQSRIPEIREMERGLHM